MYNNNNKLNYKNGSVATNLTTEEEQPLTEILNCWRVDNDFDSANQLCGIIYYHLKGIVKKQIPTKAKKGASQNLNAQLPYTTSLLHDVLVSLTPPSKIFDNSEQFFLSLASFVRWILVDDFKAKSTQKNPRSGIYHRAFDPDRRPRTLPFFDTALTKLQTLSPRSYKVALLHYFLAYDTEDVKTELGINKSTVYNELSKATAYLRTQC